VLWSAQLYYHAIFVLRRFIMVAIIFALEGYVTFQLMGFMLLNLFYTLYVVSYRPLHDQWKFEVFNELSTLLLSTILFSFTDTVSEPTFKYYISGYAFIGIFGMNVAINILCILYQAIRTLVKNVRYRVRLCKYQREKRRLKYEI
jgi:hypothetical protein